VLGPSIDFATRGSRANRAYVEAAEYRRDCLAADPEAARIFLRRGRDGELHAPAPGDLLVQPDLARTLKAIALRGADAFYKGEIARKIAATVQSGGGILTEQDLAAYKVREREPIEGTYRGHRVVSMPPPSSGGMILIGLLNVLEREDPTAGGYKPEPYLHVMVEAEKRLYAHREGWGDPDFNPSMAQIARQSISKEFARTLRDSIGDRATPAQQVVAAQEGQHTTHISVVDAQGNAVALTTTVNEPFGSCVVAQGTGVVLNDEMDDFAVAPGVPNAFKLVGAVANQIASGKRPLSSMSPIIVMRRGHPVLTAGGSGGPTIISGVLQVALNVLDFHLGSEAAVGEPRVHEQAAPDVVFVESAMPAATRGALAQMGYRLKEVPSLGAVGAITIAPGDLNGAFDPRKGGGAAGL
jgi:gamma-glutamyltranspeptidase / glutathione hydrolase